MHLPLTDHDVEAFWKLDRDGQIAALRAMAALDFSGWRYQRPVIAVGRGEVLFDYFLEKLLRRCPSVLGLYDPFYEGGETFPYHSFRSVITPGLPQHHVRIYKTPDELTALRQACQDLLIVDFAQTGPAQILRSRLGQEGYDVVDFTFYEMVMNRIAVYEHWHDYRAKTAAHFERFLKLETKLGDELSRRTLFAHLAFVFSGDRNFLRYDAMTLDSVYTAFRSDGFSAADIIVDAGAAGGDSVVSFLAQTQGPAPSFICFEPDPGNFRKLQALQEKNPDLRLDLHPAALGAAPGEVPFSAEGTASSHVQKNEAAQAATIKVPVVTLDDSVEKCSFLKMDVEGAEPDILRGARQLLTRSRPEMALCVYHYALDIVECAELIEDMGLHYRLNLRRHLPYIYELVLYANPV